MQSDWEYVKAILFTESLLMDFNLTNIDASLQAQLLQLRIQTPELSTHSRLAQG